MENLCNVDHLDADILLPPRKRLLAGLKKQNLDRDNIPGLSFSGLSSVTPFMDTSSFPSFASDDFNNRLRDLVISHRISSNLTPEEIIEASKSEAVSAMKAAEAARAAAEEKAAIAAKAIVAVKSALDIVASLSEEAPRKEKTLKKNKLKKHLPVQLLYKKYRPMENCRTDEALARKLHHAINSSPRILKNCSSSDSRNHKHKNRKTSYEMAGVACSEAVFRQDHLSLCNNHAAASKADSEESMRKHAQVKKTGGPTSMTSLAKWR